MQGWRLCVAAACGLAHALVARYSLIPPREGTIVLGRSDGWVEVGDMSKVVRAEQEG